MEAESGGGIDSSNFICGLFPSVNWMGRSRRLGVPEGICVAHPSGLRSASLRKLPQKLIRSDARTDNAPGLPDCGELARRQVPETRKLRQYVGGNPPETA